MKNGPNPALLVGLGIGAYLALTEDGQRMLRSILGGVGGQPAPQPAPKAAAPIVADPYTAAIQAAGGIVQSLLPDLSDRDSDIRESLRSFEKGHREVLHKLGLRSDPDKRKKKAEAEKRAQAHNMAGMELFASRVHQAASRVDVVEWVIDTPNSEREYGKGEVGKDVTKQTRGRITIYYAKKGRAPEPFVIWVPLDMVHFQTAWLAEPIVRATGGWTQRGGRLADGAPFVYYVDEETGSRVHAFSDTNPYAVRFGLPTASELQARRNDPVAKANQLSRVRRKLNPTARAALDKQISSNTAGYLNLQ